VQALLLIERSKIDFWMEDPVHPFLVQPVLLSAVAGSVRSTGTGRGWLDARWSVIVRSPVQVGRSWDRRVRGVSTAGQPGPAKGLGPSSHPLPCKLIPVETIDLRLQAGAGGHGCALRGPTDAITAVGWAVADVGSHSPPRPATSPHQLSHRTRRSEAEPRQHFVAPVGVLYS
jgi:hypothetical protein